MVEIVDNDATDRSVIWLSPEQAMGISNFIAEREVKGPFDGADHLLDHMDGGQ